ncbi:MAG: hypothetical protein JW709_03385 [Sedimentisphaerales bacterium]|nr:hypothetical protein [Sedimentisphaerales bacterium]
MQNKNLNPELHELETALSALTPAPGQLRRDELFFQAGRASVRKRPVFWPTLSILLAALLAVSWLYRPAPTTTERVQLVQVIKEVPASSENTFRRPFYYTRSDGTDVTSYIALRDNVLKNGLDVLNVKTPTSDHAEPIKRQKTEPLTRWNWQKLLNGESS